MSLTFWFDVHSPWVYLASFRVGDLARKHGQELQWRPLHLPRLLDQIGGVKPLEATPARVAWFRQDTRDWAEVRPEWGLAGNAAFVVAPRERTRHVDLGGRAFLHEYRWEQDPEFRVLELILTAPMIVTHWINLQYYASTVDPLRYGSGNKVLHNVVGGRLGVMEGAGGDLRIGLSRQSVHDGRQLMHEPLRLSVFVEAPADAIDTVIAGHATVRDLVQHEWLFLHRIDSSSGSVWQRRFDGWCAMDGP